jgi:hypothetical protein
VDYVSTNEAPLDAVGCCFVLASYQGTTLVGPLRNERELDFQPLLPLLSKEKNSGAKHAAEKLGFSPAHHKTVILVRGQGAKVTCIIQKLYKAAEGHV